MPIFLKGSQEDHRKPDYCDRLVSVSFSPVSSGHVYYCALVGLHCGLKANGSHVSEELQELQTVTRQCEMNTAFKPGLCGGRSDM